MPYPATETKPPKSSRQEKILAQLATTTSNNIQQNLWRQSQLMKLNVLPYYYFIVSLWGIVWGKELSTKEKGTQDLP